MVCDGDHRKRYCTPLSAPHTHTHTQLRHCIKVHTRRNFYSKKSEVKQKGKSKGKKGREIKLKIKIIKNIDRQHKQHHEGGREEESEGGGEEGREGGGEERREGRK